MNPAYGYSDKDDTIEYFLEDEVFIVGTVTLSSDKLGKISTIEFFDTVKELSDSVETYDYSDNITALHGVLVKADKLPDDYSVFNKIIPYILLIDPVNGNTGHIIQPLVMEDTADIIKDVIDSSPVFDIQDIFILFGQQVELKYTVDKRSIDRTEMFNLKELMHDIGMVSRSTLYLKSMEE